MSQKRAIKPRVKHQAGLNKVIKKVLNEIEHPRDPRMIPSLANAYGYLIMVFLQMKKTIVFERRLTDLEDLAGLTKKLIINDGSKLESPKVRG